MADAPNDDLLRFVVHDVEDAVVSGT